MIKWSLVVIVAAALVLVFLGGPVAAQEAQKPEKLSELELLRLQVLAERQNRLVSDYQVFYNKFLALPEVAALVKQSETTRQELQARVADTLHNHGLNGAEWQVSLETGEFVQVPWAPAAR